MRCNRKPLFRRAGAACGGFAMKSCLALLLPLLVAACTAPVPTATPPETPPVTDALAQVGRWKLQRAVDGKGLPIPDVLPGGRGVHALVFSDGVLGIEGGCNHIGGRYHLDAEGRLVVPDIESTLMACEDEALMRADSAVSALVKGRSNWAIAESWPEQLTLRHEDGGRSHWVADRPAR